MGTTLSYILFGFSLITFMMGVQEFLRKSSQKRVKYYYIATEMSSSIWSFCFGLIIVQTSSDTAALLRSIGMAGIFCFLASVVSLMMYWSNIHGKTAFCIRCFLLLAIPLYPFTISPSIATFERIPFGMSYELTPGLWNTFYTFYTLSIALIMIVLIIVMAKRSRKRDHVTAYGVLTCEIIILLGMILDTILPQFGYKALPGTAIAQFFGALLLGIIYHGYVKSQVTLENMSNFIYYSVNEPILIYDEMQRLKIVNNSAAEFFGDSVHEDTDTPLHEIFDVDEHILEMRGKHIGIEATCLCNQSYCMLGIDRITDFYGDTQGFIIVISDMTEKLAAIGALKLACQKADEANEAKSRFLANISHEIRTPINAVLGMDEIILREAQSQDIKNYAANIQSAGKTLLSIINDILDFSKIESGMMEIIEGDYLIGTVLADLASHISLRAQKKGLKLITEFDPNIPSVLYGDEVRIRQIILNILTNAVKYTETGAIQFHASCTEQSENQVMLDIFIKDTGIGIRKENIPLLFQSFHRVDEKSVHNIEGTGLGLSIVQRLLKLMNGTIEVKSLYGIGSIFYIHIPQKIVNHQPLGSLENSLPVMPKEYKASFEAPDAKILVVDDYKLNLQVIEGLLKQTKVQLTLISSGKECLQKIQHETYDLIFLDHMMPELDGIETLHQMQNMPENRNQNTPVIVLTANAIAGAKEMYLKEGFQDYLSKPIDSRLLEELVKKYLPDEKIYKV